MKTYDISLKDGNKFLNRFCIDEDAAFELSGVHHLQKSSTHFNQEEITQTSGLEEATLAKNSTSKGKDSPH